VACGLLVLAIDLSAFGCRTATELRIEITTDLACNEHGGTGVAVGHLGDAEDKPFASTATTCVNGRIGSLVVLPSGDKSEEVAIRVVTGVGVGVDPASCVPPKYGPNCIVARRALRFIAHTGLTVPIVMRASCRDKPCAPNTTCVSGDCVPRAIDPATCDTPQGCGDDTLNPKPSPMSGIELSMGLAHMCARMADSTVKCWGDNTAGQLGRGTKGGDFTLPEAVPGLTGVRAVSCDTYDYSCALMNDGTVKCWGGAYPPTPTEVVGPTNAIQLHAARSHACALKSDHLTVMCWGEILGAFTPIELTTRIESISLGENYNLLLMSDGNVRVAGQNNYQQLGLGPSSVPEGALVDFKAPIVIPGLANVDMLSSMAAGGNTACVHQKPDDTLCWGRYATPTPTKIAIDSVTALSVGFQSACVIRADKKVWCFPFDVASKTSFLDKVERVWNGSGMTCARTPSAIYCWGRNDHGQLGNGTKVDTMTPTAVIY